LAALEDWEREALRRAVAEDKFVYFVDFQNIGGLPTPLPLVITDAAGKEESLMLPAEIWRRNYRAVTKMFIRDTPIVAVELDRRHETADADYSNNHFPRRIEKSRIQLYKAEDTTRDLMLDMLYELREAKGGPDRGKEVPLEPAVRDEQ